MRRILWQLMAIVLVGGALLIPAAAQQTYPGSINRREARQQRRIRQGVRSSVLTRREARRIERREARIRIEEVRARRSGGRFTLRERRRIQRELNRSSRAVYRQKHDRQDRH
ncbi:MAG: hypothetical protein ACJ74W_21065 [Pyrinomonadaceae bacterium]